ncbi:nuclear body protein SP140-like protein isoform X2 [Onychostoma macrolepis]|uniref:nuclear body protein SP140-like protein isoform X2 n=1 Tax=Onychostoma macrolepis TaxID=369639 RepID=UPI002729C7E9|nr:nuclear body protein SP140-like protein isoform X2 [Onychostoma macrolepis]
MDPLEFLTNEELLFFFHRKKTEISCIQQPRRLLTQLRDHDLVPEKLFENVKKMRSRKQKEKGFYEVLEWLEKNSPQDIHQFWRCVFEDHILQLYPALRKLKNSLLDGTFKLCEEPPDVETLTEEAREGMAEKGKEKSYKRKTSKDDSSSEDSDDPDLFSAFTPSQKKPDKKPSFSSPVKKGDKQEIWTWPVHETQLPVTCGDKEGTLYRDKLLEGEKCILSQGHWFTPTAFEKFAGKEKCKNWKTSIRCRNTLLKKLIEEGHLECPQRKTRKKTCVQKQNTNERFPVSSNKSSSKATSSGSMEESEQRGKGGGTEFRGRVEEEEEEEDMADLSVFQAPSLPVTCVSLTGTLYKDRFALGSRGKCIRTEERWFTLEEFVKQEPTLTDGHWKKDILCHGKTLNFLLKKQILYIHSLLCECVKCSTLKQDVMAQNNDDECYVCRSEGDLVCCDECPRAFHSHCHLPAINGETPGEWICTFCVLRKSQQWCDSNNMSEQEAFNSPVSQYILHCHCLLLCVYREDIQKVFVKDPQQIVSRCSEFITQPMWKLETGVYQTVGEFVSDFQLIFSNCSTFNKDSEFGRMGARLKRMFEEEFRKIFSIQ